MFGGFSAIIALHILSASFSTSLSAKPNYICVKLPDIIPQLLDFSVLFLSLFYFSLCTSVFVISTKLSANALTLLNYVKSIDEHTEIIFFSETVLWVLFLAFPLGSFLYLPPLCWTFSSVNTYYLPFLLDPLTCQSWFFYNTDFIVISEL